MAAHGPDALVSAFFGMFFSVFFGAFFLIWLLALGLSIAATVFWIIELIVVCRREFSDQNTKLLWILVLVFSHGIGAIVYFFVGKQQGWLPGQGAPRPEAPSGTWPAGS